MTKLIIFDLAGVISNLSWENVATSLGSYSAAEVKSAFYFERERYFDLYETGKMSSECFWSKVSSVLCVDNLKRVSLAYQGLYEKAPEEIKAYIRKLGENYRVVMLTNSFPGTEVFVEDEGLGSLFDKIYFSHRVGVKKPSREAFENVLEDNGILAEDCIFIDDKESNVLAAREMGIEAVLFTNLEELKIVLSRSL
tara:strand:+ start:265 stop:852 length:588 start_codon:yes stop_codon:yes gene_type:complete